MALGAYGLERGSVHARVRGGKLKEAAHPLHVGIVACRVEHRALAHDIIHDDKGEAA